MVVNLYLDSPAQKLDGLKKTWPEAEDLFYLHLPLPAVLKLDGLKKTWAEVELLYYLSFLVALAIQKRAE